MELSEIISNADLTADTLTEEQKTVLTENADKLTDDDATRFGIEKPFTPPKPEVRTLPDNPTFKKKTGEGDDIEEEDEEKISKVVGKYMAPLRQQSIDNQNAIDVDTFIRDNSEKYPFASKYRATMLEYMKHPAYQQIPASAIFNIVAGNDLIKLGAEKERNAANQAKGTQTRSSSARSTTTGGKDWGSASKEEFEAKKRELGLSH